MAIHLGILRLLYSHKVKISCPYLYAYDGIFLLRIDDTDNIRSKKEYESAILTDLEWLEIEHDEFFRQSERIERYKEVMDQLISEKVLYKCCETTEEL
jgi:glutamyl/glutaminyl-tRNA synthetase